MLYQRLALDGQRCKVESAKGSLIGSVCKVCCGDERRTDFLSDLRYSARQLRQQHYSAESLFSGSGTGTDPEL